MLDANTLPNDVATLKRWLLERDREVEHLKLQLAQLRRWKFGQSSESLRESGQLPLTLEELKAAVMQSVLESGAPRPAAAIQGHGVPPKKYPVRRKHLPDHIESHDNVIEPGERVCADCGGEFQALGKADESEVLEAKTVTFKVTRHIRPKKRCCRCARIVQAPAPSRPIQKSFAGASMLALVLTWKYSVHLPLYRQCQVFAHAGLTISRTTLMQWVAGSSALLGPLVQALARYVLSAGHVNADDTPFKVLSPGSGKTKRGYLWTYVRDGTGWDSRDPPAVWYQYSPGRSGKYPQKHLRNYVGTLQVDGYAGFEAMFMPPAPNMPSNIVEVSCWAHVRRGFFDLHEATGSPTAQEAIERIKALYTIETAIRGEGAAVRRAMRQEHAVPVLAELHGWMIHARAEVENGSALAKALNYALNRWDALVRYTEDGHLEIDNNIAERSVRGSCVGKKNYLFFGSDSGGERAAIVYSLIETCKLNHVDPQRYLQYVLERIADYPINRVEELLPWNVASELNQPNQVTQELAA